MESRGVTPGVAQSLGLWHYPPGDLAARSAHTPVHSARHCGWRPSLWVNRRAPVPAGLMQSQEGSSEPPGSAEGPLGAGVAVKACVAGDWGGVPRDPRSVPQITLLVPVDNSD